MKKECVIGRAELIDLPSIARLYEEVYEEWACLSPEHGDFEQAVLSMKSVVEAYRAGTLLAAKVGEYTVGACVAELLANEEDRGMALCLRGLAGHPDCPGAEVGSYLLKHCAGMMEQAGAEKLRLECQPLDPQLRRLCESRGLAGSGAPRVSRRAAREDGRDFAWIPGRLAL